MTIKAKFLVSAAAAGVLALSGTAASAQGMFGFGGGDGLFANAEGYVKGFGGVTLQQGSDVDLYAGGSRFARGDIDFDTGYTLGAAVGANFTPNFGMELEYAYRRSDVDRLRIAGDTLDGGKSRSDAFMLNALYNFDGMGANGQWRPYAGGGVGLARVRIGPEGDSVERNWILAYQLIGGVAYDITPDWSLNAEVRWFATEGGRYDIGGGANAKADWETIDVLVGATYRF